jgi:hypothetical protein
MTAVALPTVAGPRTASSVWPLARIEARRYARHPLFQIGFALGVVASAGERGPNEFDYHVIPSFFIGVFGIIVAARLTASTQRSRSIVDAAPTSQTQRTAALCLACLVPAAAGLVLVVLHRAFVLADPIPLWKYGTYGAFDRFLITMVVPVIACAGGPLLGVAVGRWLRFPASGLLTVTTVLAWSNIAAAVPEQSRLDPASPFARVLHVLAPYTSFAEGNNDLGVPLTRVRSYTGSVTWFAVWTLTLCGLAATAALWHGAVDRARRVVGRTFTVLAVAALIALVATVLTGNQRQYDTTTTGTSTAASSSSGG